MGKVADDSVATVRQLEHDILRAKTDQLPARIDAHRIINAEGTDWRPDRRKAIEGCRRTSDEVGDADELGCEAGARPPVDCLRRADLDDAAICHDSDTVGKRHRLGLVVGHEDSGQMQSLLQRPQFKTQPVAQLGVEVGQWLVEEEQPRLGDQRPGECRALLLASGKLAWIALGEIGELDQFEGRGDATPHFRFADPLHPKAEGDIVGNGHVGEERVALEDHRRLACVRWAILDFDAVEPDDSLVRLGQPRYDPEQRRLPATRRAQQRQQVALGDAQADSIDS